LCEFLDLLVMEALLIGTAIENLQGGDLVFMLLDELRKRIYQRFSFLSCLNVKLRAGDRVLAEGIDDLLVRLANVNHALPQFGDADDGTDGIVQKLLAGGGNLRLTRLLFAGGLPCSSQMRIRIQRPHEPSD